MILDDTFFIAAPMAGVRTRQGWVRSQQQTSFSFEPGERCLMENHFAVRLAAAVRRCGNPVLVGLDPRAESLPAGLLSGDDRRQPDRVAAAYGDFCRGVIDVVAPLVAVVKPQAAFFEQQGPAGMAVLAEVIAYARSQGLLVILDGKRNDIGSTATAYAHAYLGPAEQHGWGADALTVSPYLGEDSLEPFVEVASENGGGIFVLVKTSNPGGGRFQDLVADGRTLHAHVGELVEQLALQTLPGEETGCAYGSVGAVAGATYPEQLEEIRQSLPHCWLLVPGFGAQGGGAADVAGAFDASGLGAIVNSSRGIIFAHDRDPYREQFGDARWQEAVEAATHEMISQLRDLTPAGQLSE
jgi:orotidine-5'-phosphate decarboxylase